MTLHSHPRQSCPVQSRLPRSRSLQLRTRQLWGRQRGAAVLLALLVVVIATVIVSGLFWRQFVLFRTIENQQLHVQSMLLLRGAQDWARTILQDQSHPAFDALSDGWAQPLAPTQLDQLGDVSPLAARATLEGSIQDAQARFNLRNLVNNAGQIDPVQLGVLDKLASLLGAPQGTGELIAQYLARAYAGVPAAPSGSNVSAVTAALDRPVPPVFPEDLAAVPGIDPGAAQTLAHFVILLDQGNTAINFNTAGPELMAAVIPDMAISDANALAAERDRAYFTSVADIQNRLHGRGGSFSLGEVSTNSQYFIVQGTVRLDHASTQLRALVRRSGAGAQGSVDVLWEQEG